MKFCLDKAAPLRLRLGSDYAKGGAILINDNKEILITCSPDDGEIVCTEIFKYDVWWHNDWTNPGVLTSRYACLDAGV